MYITSLGHVLNIVYLQKVFKVHCHKHPLPQHPHQGIFPLTGMLEMFDIFLVLTVSQLLRLLVLSRSES